MPKRKARRAPKRRIAPRGAWTGGFELLVVDNGPLRDEAAAAFQTIERECQKAAREIERFEATDLPAFAEWEARTFGELLTALREVHAELASKTGFLNEVEDEMFFSGCSELTAYKRVKRQRENPDDDDEDPATPDDGFQDADDGSGPFGGSSSGPEDRFQGIFEDGRDLPPDFDIHAFDAASPAIQDVFRSYYEEIAEMFELFTGLDALPLEAALARERERRRGETSRTGTQHRNTPGNSSHPPTETVDQRIPTLYRRLVRRLHPDHNTGLSVRETELWHDLQEAYRARDLARMESLEARLEAGTGGDPSRLSIGTLRGLVRDLTRGRAKLEAALRRARRHPAWKFNPDSKKVARLEVRERNRLKNEIRLARTNIDRVTRILDRLEARANQPPKPRKSAPAGRTVGASRAPHRSEVQGDFGF